MIAILKVRKKNPGKHSFTSRNATHKNWTDDLGRGLIILIEKNGPSFEHCIRLVVTSTVQFGKLSHESRVRAAEIGQFFSRLYFILLVT